MGADKSDLPLAKGIVIASTLTVLMGLGMFLYIILMIRIVISEGSSTTVLLFPTLLMAASGILMSRIRHPVGLTIGAVSSLTCSVTLLLTRLTFLPQMTRAGEKLDELGTASSDGTTLVNMEVIPDIKLMTLALAIYLLAVGIILLVMTYSKYRKLGDKGYISE